MGKVLKIVGVVFLVLFVFGMIAFSSVNVVLSQVIEERSAGTGPTSIWLSGGWDSTAVFGIGQKVMRSAKGRPDLRPVSISYPAGDPGREDELIEAVTSYWNVPVHWLDIKRIPLLDEVLDSAASLGYQEAILGMAHRGRLNVLANLVGKSFRQIFREFEGDLDPSTTQGTGDVKYHLGAVGKFVGRSGVSLPVTLASNPSHLEAVDPVLEGIVRAKQDRKPIGTFQGAFKDVTAPALGARARTGKPARFAGSRPPKRKRLITI